MAEHPLNESFQTIGDWYLPETPDRKIAGDFHYTPNGTTLDLHEPFQAMRGVLRTSDTPQKYPIIHGTTRAGEAVTLLNAQRAGGTFNIGSGGLRETERVFTVWSIVGAHLPSAFVFPKVSFRIPGLQIWLSRQTIENSLQRDETTRETTLTYRVHGRNEERFRIQQIGATVGWGTSRRSTTDPFTSISVTVSGWLIINPDEPRPIEWYMDQQSKVATMLAFLAGTPMSPDLIEASIDDSSHRVSVMVALRDAKYCLYKNPHDFFMPRSAMVADLSDILNNWFAVYEKVDKPSQLALSVLGSEKLWLHVEFLSLIQALEGFHRGLIDGSYMPESEYETVKKALGEAIPAGIGEDHKSALRSRIRYGNQYSLQKRLGELADRLEEPIRLNIFGQLGRVPRQWVDTRNFYTHWDEALSANTLDGAGMYYAIVRMRHFLRVLYLDLMGIPQHAILSSLQNTSDSSQHLIQLNAAERRAANPSDMSGAYARITEYKGQTEVRPTSSPAEPSDTKVELQLSMESSMRADALVELGSRAYAEKLFSYPNTGHEDQSLEATIEHYFNDSLRREGLPTLRSTVELTTGNCAVRISGGDASTVNELARRYQAFFDVGKIGLQLTDAFQAGGRWDTNWRFLLPLGVPIAYAKAVEIMDFPPLTLIKNQDYLRSKTTSRWWELLVINGVSDAEKALYSCILDIVPVAAPASDGEKLRLSGIYDGPFDDYGLPLLQLLARSQDPTTRRPLIALGLPIRTWIQRNWNIELNVPEIGVVTLKDGATCAVIASNHPSFFYYAVNSNSGAADSAAKNLAAGLAVMKQDIVSAAWHAEMGRNPTGDPHTALQASTQRWKDRDAELLDLVKKQAGIVTPLEVALSLPDVATRQPTAEQLRELEKRFYAEGMPSTPDDDS